MAKEPLNEDMCNVPDDILLKLQKDVSEIKTALLGNEYNDSGLIKRQCDTEERVKRLKEKQEADSNKLNSRVDRVYWTAGGISFGVSLIIGVIYFILNVLEKS